MSDIDRLPPHSIEAEEAVLGSILIDPEAIYRVNSLKKADDFFLVKNQWVWLACQALHTRRVPLDFVTITRELADRGQLDELGGPAYISHLLNVVPTAIHAEHYADIVARAAVRRRGLAFASATAQAAYDTTLSTAELCDQIERGALAVRPDQAQRTLALAESVRQYSSQLERRYEQRDQLLGVPTGYPDLDRLLDGLQRSDLIIVAARPGQGKTSLMLNIALNAARRFHQRVAIFSMEMSHLQLTERLTAQVSGINSQRLRSGQLTEEDWVEYNTASSALSELAILIDDTPGLTPGQLAASARRLHVRQPLDLIVVDYLQLMAGSGRPENRNQEIAQISRELKNLARELDVPVLVASQLSRAVEQRADKRPVLSDLRDSGAIEQDGDVILFIYREGAYDANCPTPNLTELIVAKQRKGPTGTVELYWQPHLTQFCSVLTREVQL